MNIKKAVLVGGMAIAIISMIGNYLFFVSKQLKEPIMLKHYYDTSVGVGSMLDFHYVTNRNDDVGIAWFMILDSDIMLPVSFEETRNTYRHYQHKTVHIEVTEDLYEKIKDKKLQLTQLQIYFTNGDSHAVDVGEIILHDYKPENSPVDFRASGGSNQNIGFFSGIAEKDMKIKDIEIPFPDKLKSNLKLYASLKQYGTRQLEANIPPEEDLITKDSFPITRNKGDYFTIDYHIQFNKNDKNRLHFYSFVLRFIGDDGKSFSNANTIYYQPELTEKDITAIVQGDI